MTMGNDSSVSVFVTPPSALEGGALKEFVAVQYGAFEGWASLGGEEDLNVRVGLGAGPGFLKVAWVDTHGFAEFQTSLISYLSRHESGLAVPAIIPTFGGADSVVSEELGPRPVHLRMTTFLPGVTARGLVLDAKLLESAGRELARLDVALADFPIEVPARPTNWNILRVADLLEGGASLQAEDAGFWRSILEEFVASTIPELSSLPVQLIHNDLNGSNLLVDVETSTITGLFDFGDVVTAPRIVDLGVAVAYLVDGSSAEALRKSLHSLITGYHSHSPLTAQEIVLVPEIMKARYAMALTLNHARAEASDDPDYITYVLRNAAPSRTKLTALTELISQGLADQLLDHHATSQKGTM